MRNSLSKLKGAGSKFSVSLIALILSILVGAVVVAALGKDPLTVYGSLLMGGFGNPLALTGTINRMIPIIFCGLAIAVGQKCSVFNIGVEGQFLIGSLLSAYLGVTLDLPPILMIPIIILAGGLGGLLWAIIPAVLRHKKNVSVVFSTIMMNYVALYLANFLIGKMPGYESMMAASPKINENAIIPNMFPTPFGINFGILISLAAVVIVYIYIFRTKAGYDMRAVGYNQNAARSAGINVKKNAFLVLLISGMLAGFAGSVEVSGTAFRLQENYNPGYLPTGIAVAMLGQGNPFAIVIASFLFAAMKNGAAMMQTKTGMSAQFVSIVQGLIIIFICSENLILWIYHRMLAKKARSEVNG